MSDFQLNLKITFNDKQLNRVTLYVHVTRYMCTTRSQFNNCRILTVHQFTTNAQNNLHPNQYTYRPVQTSHSGCKWHDDIKKAVLQSLRSHQELNTPGSSSVLPYKM